MRIIWLPKWLFVVALCASCCEFLFARELTCGEVGAMARMTRAKSSTVLAAEKKKAGGSYRAHLVFAVRSLELQPKAHRAAVQLLNLIPKNDEQQKAWMTLGDSLCDGESLEDMKSLGRVGQNLPRSLAKAALLAPERLLDYVSYALISIQDPHSDYAVQMQAVCRAKHTEFLKSVGELPSDKRDWFVKHVLNPDGCRAVAIPEAE